MLASLHGLQDTLNTLPWLWYTLAGLVGACVGSFMNVVVWRLPIMLKQEWDSIAADQLGLKPPSHEVFTLSKPASHCPHCKQAIRWRHNLPVIGWLLLHGKCHDCEQAISPRYPTVELFVALISIITAYYFPPTFIGVAALSLAWMLVTIALIDWDTQLIPDKLSLPLLWAGLLVNLHHGFTTIESAVVGAVAGYLTLWSCFQGFKIATGKEGMGYGDFKLLAALGAWFGWQALPAIILIAALSGASVGISQRLLGSLKANQAMPFGPWLATAGACYLLWGNDINQLLFRQPL